MKTITTLILLTLAATTAFAQNEMWNLPVAEQDTTITNTIAQARIDTVWHITSNGRRVVQFVYDAEHVAARLRGKPLNEWVDPLEVERKVRERRREIADALDRLDAETMAATEYRQAARTIRATAREYRRTLKKGNLGAAE